MIKITYSGSADPVISDDIWQYDYGQYLQVSGLSGFGDAVEVHFALQKTGGTALEVVAVVEDGSITAQIPDTLLENDDTTKNYKLYCFVYPLGDASGETAVRIIIPVYARPKPEYYDTPAAELTPFDAIAAAVAEDAAEAAASAEAAAASEASASASETSAEASATSAATSEAHAAASAAASEASATLAESYAVGGTGTRTGEDTDNAKHYAEVAQQGAEESGFAFFSVNVEDGNAYVTVTDNLAESTSFAINTESGEMEVTVNG